MLRRRSRAAATAAGLLVLAASAVSDSRSKVELATSAELLQCLDAGCSELVLDGRASGTLPTELGTIRGLTRLELLDGALHGSVPTELGLATELRVLRLSGNALSGTVPAALGALAALEKLELAANRLGGKIPTSLGALPRLTSLDLSSNRLRGRVPPSLVAREDGVSVALESLQLEHNVLTGTLPTELGLAAHLRVLALGDNWLSGTLPPQLGGARSLRLLNVARNRLRGAVPAELLALRTSLFGCELTEALAADVSNRFTAPLPPGLADFCTVLLAAEQDEYEVESRRDEIESGGGGPDPAGGGGAAAASARRALKFESSPPPAPPAPPSPPATAGDDPLFTGGDGRRYEVTGEARAVLNVISTASVQLHARFEGVPPRFAVHDLTKTVLGDIGVALRIASARTAAAAPAGGAGDATATEAAARGAASAAAAAAAPASAGSQPMRAPPGVEDERIVRVLFALDGRSSQLDGAPLALGVHALGQPQPAASERPTRERPAPSESPRLLLTHERYVCERATGGCWWDGGAAARGAGVPSEPADTRLRRLVVNGTGWSLTLTRQQVLAQLPAPIGAKLEACAHARARGGGGCERELAAVLIHGAAADAGDVFGYMDVAFALDGGAESCSAAAVHGLLGQRTCATGAAHGRAAGGAHRGDRDRGSASSSRGGDGASADAPPQGEGFIEGSWRDYIVPSGSLWGDGHLFDLFGRAGARASAVSSGAQRPLPSSELPPAGIVA